MQSVGGLIDENVAALLAASKGWLGRATIQRRSALEALIAGDETFRGRRDSILPHPSRVSCSQSCSA
jgi:hypothetical protein